MSDVQLNDIPVNIEDIMHTAYLQYSLSVNVGRAIPDVRDGLKPGNRRILYAMHQLGLTKGHSFTKSAKVVGEVIGNYHPHGDSSVYDTLVRMAQDFAMRAPLIDGQGNFGSIDGDPAAAYRYTECRMERLAEELLSDINKRTVDMLPTFDESTLEPAVLPARFPNLLVNGTMGIGVGMATNIPPHNLTEVINATICLMDNPAATVSELMVHLPGPDFPTGAIIRGLTEIRRLYETGRGVLRIRAKADIEDKDGKERIIITEIPYAVNKENLVKKIADLVNEKKITGISALRDETSRRTGIRIVVDVKRNAMGNVVLNQLYAHTSLENAFGCVMMVVDGKRPRIMNLRMVLQAYIEHRLEVVTRRTRFELEKAEARLHILEGLLIAVANIDEVVKIIRGARNREDAAAALKSRFDLSDIQTSAILDMRLHQLTGLAIETLEREHREVSELVDRLKALLASREALLGVVRDELIEIRDKYGDERRTELTIDDSDINIADLIPRHSCVITVTNTGYLKRVPTAEFRTQHRGGKGVIGMETKDEDYVEHLFNADSHDIIFFITDRGVMHWLNVFEIPEGARTGKGKAIINMVKVQPGESIRAMLTVCKEDLERDDLFLTMATRKGIVKKTALSAFKNLRRAGIRALKIRDEDDLVEASVTTGDDEIILSTAKGLACRFAETDVRSMGRVASGVTGVKFKLDGDYVVGMAVVPSLPEDTDEDDGSTGVGPELLVVSNGGMGKRSFVSKYRKTRRGAKGVRNINLAEGESVVAALLVEPGDELIITTTLAQTVRIPVDEVRTVGRASKGVRIMRFKKDGDEITGVAKVVKVEADGDDGESSGEDAENADGGAVNANIAEAAAPGKENPSVEESGAEKKNTGDSEDSNPDESNA
jgi:DNA gyrase subunit A